MYTHGKAPIRALVALYSMVLNGYSPWGVSVFGEHQWDQRTCDLFAGLAPFARVVPTEQVLADVKKVGGPRLAEMARRHWFVMKAFVALMYPGEECCLMDDDVVVIDGVDDALSALQFGDLVFTPDLDRDGTYRETWPWIHPVPRLPRTGTFNAALYWIRSVVDPRVAADYALRSEPAVTAPHLWEQGLIATLYAYRNTRQLPTQRYLYPKSTVAPRCPRPSTGERRRRVEGLPDGILGYDYAGNPCGFASIHFGALGEQFSDAVTLRLAPQILRRCRTSNPPLGLEEVARGRRGKAGGIAAVIRSVSFRPLRSWSPAPAQTPSRLPGRGSGTEWGDPS